MRKLIRIIEKKRKSKQPVESLRSVASRDVVRHSLEVLFESYDKKLLVEELFKFLFDKIADVEVRDGDDGFVVYKFENNDKGVEITSLERLSPSQEKLFVFLLDRRLEELTEKGGEADE